VARLCLRASRAWLGRGNVAEDVQIVCEDGVITYAGVSTPIDAADREVVLDGFLMPAVADRHVHIGLADPAAVLLGGVTAVRDLAWPPDVIFPLADASELPSFNGPLIRAAGPIVTAPGGYPTEAGWAPPGTGVEVRGPDEAAAMVRELADRGAAAIKVSLNAEAGPTLSDAELTAIVDAAHERSLPVTAHAQGKGQAARALGAGVDEFAHCPWTERLADSLIEAMARTMRIVSTLDIQSYGRDTPEIRTALDNLRRFHAAGGAVMYGTDLGNGPVPPGVDLREVLLLREAGLSNEDVLAAMTRSRLEAGAPADLVGYVMDPLENLGVMERVELVVRAGSIVSSG